MHSVQIDVLAPVAGSGEDGVELGSPGIDVVDDVRRGTSNSRAVADE